MRPEEQVSRKGGELWLSETKLHGKFTIGWGGGGVDFERVNVSHLGGSWGMLPQQIFNFKPSEIAGNAFKTNMVWWNLHTFKNKKSRHKKKFSTKSCVALIGVLLSSKQHKELGPACQS